MAPSDDDLSELLDEDALPPEYPPDRPLGVNQYGTTPQEERVDEPIDERVRREDHGEGVADRPVLLLDETEDGLGAAPDLDAGETGDTMLGETGEGSWAGDDLGPNLGPPTSDLASDRVPLAAEEAAVHIVDPEMDSAMLDDEL
jgi:hypothetical protein